MDYNCPVLAACFFTLFNVAQWRANIMTLKENQHLGYAFGEGGGGK